MSEYLAQTSNPNNILPISFYKKEVLLVARNLLGKIIVRKYKEKTYIGKIVEVEAYNGSIDESSHSFKGRTNRNEVMFRGGGFLYVYFIYGKHFCANVVTGNPGDGCAVLIRAVEPLYNKTEMIKNRFGKDVENIKSVKNISNGPAKLCQAFCISMVDNGTDLSGNDIFLLNQKKIIKEKVGVSKRIGIKKSKDFQWRYFIKNNLYVSVK